ncbi:MAG: DUF2865 domain-containing protein [Methylocystis sp.]|uniref:DUF2865 domain-containing protein n=1 Tax=Methylocystis sp. TaxID=1911079 RepID=UPI003D141E75
MRLRAPKASVRYAKPDAKSGAKSDPASGDADSMQGGGYCVRSCDGYYFPLVKSSHLSGQQSCEYACPSARVELYQGSSIEQARNAQGERYLALSTAFSFREKLTARCSCNDPAGSHEHYVQLSGRDPTLRSGDIVIGDAGARVYSGARLVSVSHASRRVRTQLRHLLQNAAPREADAVQDGSLALAKTHRREK